MKLNFGRRLILFVHWLLSLALIVLGIMLFVWDDCRVMAENLIGRLDVFIYAVAVLLVYLLFAVGAVGIIFGGRKRNSEKNFIVVDAGESGHTRIAVSAVEQMIRQAVRGVNGIAEMKANIINNQDSIDIVADVAIYNGTHVPTVTEDMRQSIRGYIEHNCGVSVRSVNVNVHSLQDAEQANGKRSRKKKTDVGNDANPAPVSFPGDVEVTPSDMSAGLPPESSAEPAIDPAEVPLVSEKLDGEEAPSPSPAGGEEVFPGTKDPETADEETGVEEPTEVAAAEESNGGGESAAQDAAPAVKRKKGLIGRIFNRKEKHDTVEAEAGDVSGAENAEEDVPAAEAEAAGDVPPAPEAGEEAQAGEPDDDEN